VLYIGINISTSGFPQGLDGIAGSLYCEAAPQSVRNRLAAALMDELLGSDEWLDKIKVLEEYRKRDALKGRRIAIERPGCRESAVAISIVDEFRLVALKKDGSTEALSFGEVSLRV
jgi:BirA family biotin operon repressor/biotin-[acetyl-CoA-carboxylase] ligase